MVKFLSILLITLSTALCSQKADILILSKPSSFTIYNKYEQPLNDAENKLFLPNTPIQVVSRELTMGDQISKALKFNLLNETFFLLKDGTGKFSGPGKVSDFRTYQDCTVLNDTLTVANDNSVLFATGLTGAAKTYLSKGETVLRFFQYDGSFYCRTFGVQPKFGWCSVSGNGFVRNVSLGAMTSIDNTEINTAIRDKILNRIKDANQMYQHYFDYFNTKSGDEKSTPAWRITEKDQSIRCVLTDPYRKNALLEESTQYLVQDIENVLLGKPFSVQYTNGEIVINPKR